MLSDQSPLIHQRKQLERFPGKGGWTYILLPEVPYEKSFPFGMVRVQGSLDDYVLGTVKLMPKGNKELFLPVNARIRKALGKSAGDEVWVKLYKVAAQTSIPKDVLDCLNDSPGSLKKFEMLPLWKQTMYLEAIVDAPSAQEKTAKVLKLLTDLEKAPR